MVRCRVATRLVEMGRNPIKKEYIRSVRMKLDVRMPCFAFITARNLAVGERNATAGK